MTTSSTAIGRCARQLFFSLCCCHALLHPGICQAQADIAIVAIDAIGSENHVDVNIEFDATIPALPTHFATQAPARIVLDLPATGNATGTSRGEFPPASGTALVHSYAIARTALRTRIVLNLASAVSYTVSSVDRRLIVRLHRPLPTPAHKKDPQKLSLNLHNIEVRKLLQQFADFTGLNIVVSDSVSGSVTLRLREVDWQQALDIILRARGLEFRQHGSVLWIAPRTELLLKEKDDAQQRVQLIALEPLHTEVFQLNYQKADSFRKLFSIGKDKDGDVHPHLLSPRGSTLVDQRTNQLFVTDTQAVLDKVRTLLSKVDIASRQVQIEARIVEADDSFSRNLGVRLGFSATPGPAADQQTATDNPRGIHLPAAPIGAFPAGNVAWSLFGASAERLLNLELSALEADGKGQIISSPRVVTADQQAALIEQGEEIPYQQATTSGATSTAFKKANLKLEVTPRITPAGNIILNVDISKDSRGIATQGGLAINTKHVKTQVQVEDGGTVVIGGIYTRTETDHESKVPLLGDLPLLGHLFKNTEKISNKTELLIFLTPKIVPDGNLSP